VFINVVREYYRDKALPFMEYLLEEGIDAYEEELKASATMDSIRWKDMYMENGYVSGGHKEYEDLKEFIRERIEFLNKE